MGAERQFDVQLVRTMIRALRPSEQQAILYYAKKLLGMSLSAEEIELLNEVDSKAGRQFDAVKARLEVAEDDDLIALLDSRHSSESCSKTFARGLKAVDRIILVAHDLTRTGTSSLTTTLLTDHFKKLGFPPIEDISTLVRHLAKDPKNLLELIQVEGAKRLFFKMTPLGKTRAEQLERQFQIS